MKRILVVDDDSGMRMILKRFLERDGYRVEEAVNGAEAMEHLRACAYDLVITDLVMPEKTGFELINELHALRPGAKVIAFSGGGVVGAEACLDIARRDGAARTFPKPFDMAELLDAVKELA
jgi:two-component system response regulator PilR (NtrC family)